MGDKPATYERWDRLSAESEFRQAVVPPILAIVAALFSRGVLSWPLGGLFIIPAFVILIQGVIKENEANGQLVQALEANVITSPAIDRLRTNDLYWRASIEIQVKIPGQASSEDKTAALMQEGPIDNAGVGHLSTTQPGSPPKRED